METMPLLVDGPSDLAIRIAINYFKNRGFDNPKTLLHQLMPYFGGRVNPARVKALIEAPVITVYVNLFAGPGTGKSTTAAEVFAKLKRIDSNAELITEYAKERVWQKDFGTLTHQLYVTAKQTQRQYRVKGHVEVAVTDSPILLGGFAYPGAGSNHLFLPYMVEVFHEYQNLNIFLDRDAETHAYNTKGRSQTEEEAKEIDRVIRLQLDDNGIDYYVVKAGPDAADQIVKLSLMAGVEFKERPLLNVNAHRAKETPHTYLRDPEWELGGKHLNCYYQGCGLPSDHLIHCE